MAVDKDTSVAFDAIAADYDDSFTHTAVGSAQRERVWHFLSAALSQLPIRNILECNCGTGEDARWLAQQGHKVLATDVSQEMIAIARAKAQRAGIGQQIETAVCAMQDISTNPSVTGSAPFNFLLSDFGGLNCLSPSEIRQLNIDLRSVTTTNAMLALVVMSRFSWWETLYFLWKGKPRAAFRRFRRKPLDARLDAQTTIPTWYYAPRELSELLSDYEIKKCYPVGFWLPPSYLDPFFQQRPRALKLLKWLEKKSAPAWLAPGADHYFLLLERKSTIAAD